MRTPSRLPLLSLLAAATLLAAALVAAPAHARGQLQTRQTGIELPPGARAGRLVLANSGDKPVAAQIRVYRWTQGAGEDVLEPSNALVASPAIVEIAPGAVQLVRVVRQANAAPAAEEAYRVVVDELPGDPDADAGNAVTVRMRYLLPAFVRADAAADAAVSCTLAGTTLGCRNTGGRAAQFGATTLVGAGGREAELTPGLLGYVLAGSSRRWTIDAAKRATVGTPASLRVRLNGQPATVALTAAP